MFASRMHIENNTATVERDTGEYRIVISVQRKDAKAITQSETEEVLTTNLLTMFNQRASFGGRR
jgi:hypothetical protein